MSNFVFNVALGSITEKARDGATLKMLILKAAGADATLKDLDTVAAVLAEGSTTEADFTSYARVTLANVAATVDDTNDETFVDCDDIVLTDVGGAINNTTTDVLIYEEVTDDSDSIPLVMIDAVFTTDGSTINLTVPANGFFGAS